MKVQLISRYRSELMGIAIINVMIAHFLSWSNIDPNCNLFIKVLSSSCRLLFTEGFLLLSGFGLYYSFVKNEDLKSFYHKRIKRLLIPFLIISFPFYIYLDFVETIAPTRFLLDISTVYFWIYGNNGMWYISVSLLLYALFPLFCKFIFKKQDNVLVRMLIICLLFTILSVSIYVFFPDYYQRINIGLDKIVIFILGIYLGYIAYSDRSISFIKSFGILTTLLCILHFYKSDYVLADNFHEVIFRFYGLLILCILAFKTERKGLKNRFWAVFSWLGKYSLELYILHMLFYSTIVVRFEMNPIFAILLALLFCMPIGKVAKYLTDRVM
ncbi:MAG: acyltransferase [Muribaculaceae bacterium]|nr:acyltransferase [Muribaculaceae bacterium]